MKNKYTISSIEDYSLRKYIPLLKMKVLHVFATIVPMPSKWRVILQSFRGVRFKNKNSVFIGENVVLDGVYPHNINIGSNVIISYGAMILTHYYSPEFKDHTFVEGTVNVGDNVYIGAKAIIASEINVGKGSIIAAGAVVVNDVPENSIVGGIPAKIIGYRGKK